MASISFGRAASYVSSVSFHTGKFIELSLHKHLPYFPYTVALHPYKKSFFPSSLQAESHSSTTTRSEPGTFIHPPFPQCLPNLSSLPPSSLPPPSPPLLPMLKTLPPPSRSASTPPSATITGMASAAATAHQLTATNHLARPAAATPT